VAENYRQKGFGQRLFTSIVKAILVCCLLGLFILLFWRMCAADSVPNEMKVITPTPAMVRTYGPTSSTAYPEGDAFYQTYGLYTYNEEAYGYFSAPQAIFFTAADELQVVVRYNISTLKKIAQVQSLTDIPARDADIFDYSVVMTRVDGGEVRYQPTQIAKYNKGLYCYARLVFSGCIPTDNTEGVFVDFYYVGENGSADYTETPLAALCLYENINTNIPYRFTNADKDALTSAVGTLTTNVQ